MKIKISVITLLIICTSVLAQKKPKIQGNKVVVDVYKSLEDFSAIEISDNLVVSLTQTEQNGYHLKTDENLTGIVRFDVVDDVLKIYTINRITSFKKLEINVTFKQLDEIAIRDDVELESLNKLNCKELTFTAINDATYKLDLAVENGTFLFSDSTKGELLLRGIKANLVLNENAYLNTTMSMDTVSLHVNKRSDINISGDVLDLQLTATGSTDIKAKKLKATSANIIASNYSDIYMYVGSELKLYAQGKSNIYVYGNPNIQVEGLNDKSQIIKK
jgi:hypothetical protein